LINKEEEKKQSYIILVGDNIIMLLS